MHNTLETTEPREGQSTELDDLIERAQQRWDSDRARRAAAAKLFAMAGGDQIRHIPKMPAEPESHNKTKPRFAPNLLGFALSQLSYLYDEEPKREMETPEEQEWAQRALWEYGDGLDAVLAFGDTATRLGGLALAHVCYRPARDAALVQRRAILEDEPLERDPNTDGVELIIYERDRFCVVTDELDPRRPVAVLVQVTQRDERDSATQAVSHVQRMHFWSREHFATLERTGSGSDGAWKLVGSPYEHSIGALPFVVMRNALGSSELEPRLATWGGEDLVDNICATNSVWTEYFHTARLQRGQPWSRGDLKTNTLAPDAIIQMPPDGDFGIAGNQANLTGMRETIETGLGFLSKTLGLPARSLTLNDSGAQSGVAITLSRAELADDRRSREKLARTWEREAHHLAALVYNAWTDEARRGDLVRVEYTEPTVEMSASEKREQLKFELDYGLIGKRDAIRRLYPAMSDEDVDERLQRVVEELPIAAVSPAQP